MSLGSFVFVVACAIATVQSAQSAAEEVEFPGSATSVATIVEALRGRRPLALKPVGTTSVVFKMDLEGSIDAAFRPRTRRHPRGHLAEVAAFRIGRALGLHNIAPAVPRTLSLGQIEDLLGVEAAARFQELSAELVAQHGSVDGVAIYWIPDMHELGLDTKGGVQRWQHWLAQDGELPSREKSKLIAADVSRMVCFDYLIGNWDRFSGANAQGDHSEKHLFVRDHNVAFFEPLPRVQHARILGYLKHVERFSRSFVNAVKALDAERLRGALRDPGDSSELRLLETAQFDAVLDRRRGLLSYMAAMIDRHGEQAVLAFP